MEPLTVAGIRLGAACAGIKYPDRRDLVVIEATAGTRAAAVFTRNAFRAAPVTVARVHLAAASPRYLLINTGNANAGTGRQGLTDAEASCQTLAELTGCTSLEVLPFPPGSSANRCRCSGWWPDCRQCWRHCGQTVGKTPHTGS